MAERNKIMHERYSDFKPGELYSNNSIISHFSGFYSPPEQVSGFSLNSSDKLSDEQLEEILYDASSVIDIRSLPGDFYKGIPKCFHERMGLRIHPRGLQDVAQKAKKFLIFTPSEQERYEYRGTISGLNL